MLRCISRYRNAELGLFAEPGEILRDLSEADEAFLLRDSPGSFEVYDEPKRPTKRALDAPPAHRMIERERVARKASERAPGEVMTRETHSALVRQEEV